MAYGFDQFLNARSAYGAAVDAAGDRLVFISDLTGSPQLWSLPVGDPGAWPEPVAVGLDRVMLAVPSSRPGRLVFGADIGGNERMQLYLLDGYGRPPVALTDSMDTIHVFGGWHPNGASIVFSSNERDARFFDVYLMNVETGARRLLFQGDGSFHAGGFSPDGSSVLVLRADVGSDQTAYVLNVDSGALRPIVPADRPARYAHLAWSQDGTSVFCITDHDREFLYLAKLDAKTGALTSVIETTWDIEDYKTAPNGQLVAYEVNADGFSEIHVRDLAGGADLTVEIPQGVASDAGRWYHSFSWFPDSTRFAFTLATPTAPADVYVCSLSAGASGTATVQKVSRTWKAGLDPDTLFPAELVHYPTFDGRQIPAFVFRPHGDGPSGSAPAPRPTVFLVHGGPESQTRASYNPVIQYLTYRGFVVVATNVRGSSGYGKEYLHLDDVEKRLDSVHDLAKGAEWAATSGLADPQRIAVMGQSYGGFMVLSAVTEYPSLWAAGIDIYGIANFVTFMENTGPWRRKHRGAEYGTLEDHRDVLERISPIHKVDRIEAPMMVIHGANDPRVPIGETEQIVASLQARGRSVEYVRFEDEGHGIVKLKNRLVAFPKIADFLEEHLGVG